MADDSLVIRRRTAAPIAKRDKPAPAPKPSTAPPATKPGTAPPATKDAEKSPDAKGADDSTPTLDLEAPAPRGYRPRAARPRAARDFTRATGNLMWLGGLVTLALLGYVLVFTSPDRTENVLAFVGLAGFGAFFFAWAIGAWLRTSDDASGPRVPAVIVTRQAVFIAAGAVALATAAVNGVASPAAAILIVLVIISAELLIRRMPLGR